jgi:hypothetical protein
MEFPKAPVQTSAESSDPYVSDHFAGSLVMIPDAPPRPRPRSSEFFMPYEAIPPQSATSPDHAPLTPELNLAQDATTESVPTAQIETLPVDTPPGNHGFIRFDDEQPSGNLPEPSPKKPGKKGVAREKEAPRFHNPKTLRFFDPVAAAAEREGESPDGASAEIGPRPSIELSSELKAAIIQMDEQLRQRREQQKTPPAKPKKKWWSTLSKRPLEERVIDRTAASPFAEPLNITAAPAVEAVSVEPPFEAASVVVPVVGVGTSDEIEAALKARQGEFSTAQSLAEAVEEARVEEALPEVLQAAQPDALVENRASAEPAAVAFIDEPAAAPLKQAVAAEDYVAVPTIDLAGSVEPEVVTAAPVKNSVAEKPATTEIKRETIPAAPAIAAQEMPAPVVGTVTSAPAVNETEMHLGPAAEAGAESLEEIDSVRPWLAGAPVNAVEPTPALVTSTVEPVAEQAKTAEPSFKPRTGRKKPFWSRMAPAPRVEPPAPAAEPMATVAEPVAKPVAEIRPARLDAVWASAVMEEVRVPAPELKRVATTELVVPAEISAVAIRSELLKAQSTAVVQTAPVVEIQPVRKKRVWPSAPPARVQKALPEVVPETVEKDEGPSKSKQEQEKEPKEKLSLGARLQRWLQAGEPAALLLNLDGKRNGRREILPGLVAFYFSGGAPRPHEILNISKTGLYMRTHEIWSPNTMVRMTLQRPDIHKSISVLTQVVRIDDGGVGHAFITSEILNGLRVRDVMPEHGTNQKELEEFLAIPTAGSQG